MNITAQLSERQFKWTEVWSLAGLNAAIVISWIAYHQYQPKLLNEFGLSSLSDLLVVSKALVLVLIPPVAGLIADRVLRKGGKYFTVFTMGIGITAMIFMIVATIIQIGPDSAIAGFLPIMVVLWLIAMNIFHSPANSMIEMFAPAHKLPMIMGILIMVTELFYALEPVVVFIVDFLGDTLTFVTGGVLIGVTGWLFNKVTSDEVIQRKEETLAEQTSQSTRNSAFLGVIVAGLIVGFGHAFIAAYVPLRINFEYINLIPGGWKGEYISSIFLAISALLAFPLSIIVCRVKTRNSLLLSLAGIIIGVVLMLISLKLSTLLIGASILAISFSLASVSGLPFVIRNLSLKHLTLGVGIYFGATEIFDGVFDLMYNM